jgi:hypothetical protein
MIETYLKLTVRVFAYLDYCIYMGSFMYLEANLTESFLYRS